MHDNDQEAAMLDPIAFMQATQLAADKARSARPDRSTRPVGPRPRRRRKPSGDSEQPEL
jgi:hypothetical protein